jgi:hypothetical protein
MPKFLQQLIALIEGRAPQASRALKPEVSSGLLQFSPPYPRGGLWRYRVFLMSRPVCNYVHRIVLQFYVYFYVFLISCGQSLSLYPTSNSSCAILSQAGLLEVPMTNLMSLCYFLTWGPVLPNGCSSKELMLNGGGPECAHCLAWSYTLSVYTLPH